MIEKNINTIIYGEYLRKSTDDKEKQVLSLGNQRDVLDRLKNSYNLNAIETIEEKMSAKRPGRPGFAALVKLIKTGKITGIITWAPHRLSRNSVDIGELIHLFDTGHLKEIVTESHTYRNNPTDIFMLGFHCLQAKLENDNKALDVKGGMLRCAKIGIFPGCPPLGYLPDKGGIKGARKREIDPIRFPIVKRMWELMLAGTHTPKQILAKAVNEWGLRTRKGKKPSLSLIHKIFHNPYYYGEYEYPRGSGLHYKGIHKPMISKAEFEQVKKSLARPDNPRPISNYFAFGGRSLHCGECGCAITGTAKTKRQKNGNVHHYVYYGCTKRKGNCSQMPVTEKVLFSDINAILSEIQISPLVHDLIISWVRRTTEEASGQRNGQLQSLKKDYDALQKKIAILINMRASELITDSEFQEQRKEKDNEKDNLSKFIFNSENNIIDWVNTFDELLTFIEVAVMQFNIGTKDIQRGILRHLGWNLCIYNKKIDFSKGNWIQPVLNISKRINNVFPASEPILSIYYQGKIEKLLNSKIMWSLLREVRNLIIKNGPKRFFDNYGCVNTIWNKFSTC